MKVGLVLSQPPGYSETFFRFKIRGLQESGVEVYLFCQNNTTGFDLCPIVLSPKISRNPLRQFLYFTREFFLSVPHLPVILRYMQIERQEGTNWRQLLKKTYLNVHLLKSKLEWLHFGFATMTLGSETVAKAIGAKMAVSFRGFDIAVYPIKHPGCYELLWGYVDKIHTISIDLWELAITQGMPNSISVTKITPAIDVAMFQPEAGNSAEKQGLTFMTTGRLHWKKGLVETVEALVILKAKGYKFTYKIVGEGKDYERIAFAVHQLDLKDSVQFLGKLPHSKVKEHLQTTDLYLQYSIQEGFCNAVLEAQAMGKLCIVSNAEGLSENVLHGLTGWIVPKHSPEVLADQIEKVLKMNDIEKASISNNAMDRVRQDFNLDKQRLQFLKFYDF